MRHEENDSLKRFGFDLRGHTAASRNAAVSGASRSSGLGSAGLGLLFLVASSFLLAPGAVRAACTGTTDIYCTGTDTGRSDHVNGPSTTATIENWNLTGRFLAQSTNAGATVTVDVTNMTATNTISGNPGVVHAGATGLGGNVFLTIRNSSLTQNGPQSGGGGHGAAAHANNATGSATLIMIDTDIVESAVTVNGRGAIAAAAGSGNATISVTRGSIVTGATGGGIEATSATGNASLTASGGTVTSTAASGYALLAQTGGAGTVAVDNGSVITVTGAGGRGIGTIAVAGATTIANSGAITVTALGQGISTIAAAGATTIVNSGAIAVTGGGQGIGATATAGAISVDNSGAIAIAGSGAGIHATTTSGAIGIGGTGAITTSSATSHGIAATTADGVITVDTAAPISVTGQGSNAIDAHSDSGDVDVTSRGDLSAGANGIYVTAGATASATVYGDIVAATDGVAGARSGVYVEGGAASADFQSGSITLASADADGNGITAHALTGDATVTTAAAATIATTGTGAGSGQHGIRASADAGSATVASGADISVSGDNSIGILASAGATSSVANTGTIDASGRYGIGVSAYGDGGAAVTNAGAAMGGWQPDIGSVGTNDLPAAGIVVGSLSGAMSVTNSGTVGAWSDRAVADASRYGVGAANPVTVDNSGTVTGFVEFGDGGVAFNNLSGGVFDLRHFADIDGDGTRDVKRVAVSDFGGGSNVFVNQAGATVNLAAVSAASVDTTGQYLPMGYSVNAITAGGAVQGQLLNLARFENAGTIDMTDNGLPGDVLVISGGSTPGTDGGGVFVANGGALRLDTVLNEGGANSRSDMLVVDSTRVGTGATRILVAPSLISNGSVTTGDGIALVEVLNKGASAPDAFVLGRPAAAGAYDYVLYHGGVDADADDGNWYLRNTYVPDPTPDNPDPDPEPIVRPEVAVDMVIPPLALEYGYAMLGTLHERVGETYPGSAAPVYESREVWCKDPKKNYRCVTRTVLQPGHTADAQQWYAGSWGRLIGQRAFHDGKNFMRRGADYDSTFGGFQAGLDLWGREQGGDLDKAGLYVGYGHIWSDVRGQLGTHAGKVDLDGYSLGAYWTHHAASGWYTDAVLQGTIYDATAKTDRGYELSPSGWGLVASLEGGYAFRLGDGWSIEPQAQLAYQRVNFDGERDQFGIFSFSNEHSLRGRLGVRAAKSWNRGDTAKPRLVTAWLRANVWHEFLGDPKMTVSTLSGENPLTFTTSLGGTSGEIGAGISGQVSDTTTLFGTASYNHSLDNRGQESWDGRLGMTVKW